MNGHRVSRRQLLTGGGLTVIGAGGLQFADADVVTPVGTLEALLSSPHGLPSIDLELPEAVALRAKMSRDQKQFMAAASFVAALALCGYTYWDYSHRQTLVDTEQANESKRLKQRNDKLKLEQTKLSTLVPPAEVYKITNDKKINTTPPAGTTDDAQTAIELGFKNGQRFSDVVTTVVNDAPAGLWITAISLERGKRLVLRGTAKTNDEISQFVKTLSGADPSGGPQRLRDVRLEFTNNGTIDQIPVVQFSASGFPVGNVPLADPTKIKLK